MKKSRYKPTRRALIFWTLFIGICAVAGAAGMFYDPSGKAMALLTVNGISNLIAAFLLFKNKKSGIILGGIFGITLMLWICIQFYMFPMNFMSTTYFIFGFLQAVTGYAAWVFYEQEHSQGRCAEKRRGVCQTKVS